MCVDELEVMLNDLGGPDIEFTPAQQPKQQALANAFAHVTGVREGHVQRPKTLSPTARNAANGSPNTAVGNPGGAPAHARAASWEQSLTPAKAQSDTDARLTLLEVQVQELKVRLPGCPAARPSYLRSPISPHLTQSAAWPHLRRRTVELTESCTR